MHSGFDRRVAALAAAYALALQAIFASITIIVAADRTLCVAAEHGRAQPERAPPLDHSDCAVCALSCGALAPPRRADRALDGLPAPSSMSVVAWQPAWLPLVPQRSGAVHARAPPGLA